MPPAIPKSKPSRRPCRFPDIGGAATAIGRSREHLYFVLTGARQSARVVADLKAIDHPLAPVAEKAQRRFRRPA
jgi:hypothetical protein